MNHRSRCPTGLAFTTALLCALPLALPAQVVIGHVIDAEGGQFIRFATLELLDDRAQVVVRANTDSLGAFRVRSWQPGKYRLKTLAFGYATVTSEILELATGDVLDLTVRLAPDAVPLEPITIKGRERHSLAEIALSGYYDRRDAGQRLGLGRFFDRGAIARRGRKLTDVLATIPGVRILHVQNCPVPLVSMAGNNATRLEDIRTDQLVRLPTGMEACKPASVCRANVYVDGVLMALDETISIDQTVPVDWVEAIEVYRRASEVPAEFLSRATCGVVAVWTRRG
jgi:hypothetical protein